MPHHSLGQENPQHPLRARGRVGLPADGVQALSGEETALALSVLTAAGRISSSPSTSDSELGSKTNSCEAGGGSEAHVDKTGPRAFCMAHLLQGSYGRLSERGLLWSHKQQKAALPPACSHRDTQWSRSYSSLTPCCPACSSKSEEAQLPAQHPLEVPPPFSQPSPFYRDVSSVLAPLLEPCPYLKRRAGF